MTLLETWVETPAARALGWALGWTLVHSLWQGAMVVPALAAALWATRSARVRYAAACLAMLGMLAGACFTFGILMSQQRGAPGMQGATTVNPRGLPPAPRGFDAQGRAVERLAADLLPWLAPFWMAGVLIFHLRHAASWLAVRRLRRTGVCRAPGQWEERLERLRQRLRLSRPVTLLESCLAEVPVVIGHVRPVILMPVGLLAGLPAGQVEAILLHELAHIRRFDYLVNLLQTFVEGLLFYHPAVWWISNVIRAERENCCDDLVVATSGDAHEYAVALAALEENRSATQAAALAATGGSLVKRIRRLLGEPEGPRVAWTPVFSAGILTITAALALAAWQSQPAGLPLDSPYSKWLNEDVAYITTDQERAAFQRLQTDAEREHFIEQFWLRRDPTPGTAENEFKEEHYRRIAYANEHFGSAHPGWKTDRGWTYIKYGPPDEIESHPAGSYSRPAEQGGRATAWFPFEQWLYRYGGGNSDVLVEFVDRTGSGDYRMTRDPSAKEALPSTPSTTVVGAAIGSTGATVQVLNGGAMITIPLGGHGDHRVDVFGRIVTQTRRLAAVFTESVQGSAPVYTRFVTVPAGSYRLNIVVKDATTGTLTDDNIEFEVK